MLLAKENDEAIIGGLNKGRKFSIFASAKVFDILSSRIYQNEILAVIREITCNAADAHKVTGRPLSDIEVHLPTFTQPYFAVRDHGPGMSCSTIENLYTTYFMSDKDESNDMIGGFGLGSKSPFAVADQFTVTSWHGGERHDYVMYKEDGCPNVNHVGSTPSSDPCGLEVRVAATNLSRWQEEASRFFSWWPVLPVFNTPINVHNMFDAANIFMQSDTKTGPYPDWAFFNKMGPGNHKLIAFMGLVPYVIDVSAIPNLPAFVGKLTSLGRGAITFTFDIGALTVSPSREALSYDPATCAALLKRFEGVQTVITTQMQAKLDAQPDLLAARQFVWGPNGYASFTNTQTYPRVSHNNYLWNGQAVKAEVRLDTQGATNAFSVPLTTASFRYASYGKNPWQRDGYPIQTIYHGISRYAGSKAATTFYVWMPDPVTAKTYRILKYFFEQKKAAKDADYKYLHEVIMLSGCPFAEVESVFKAKGLPAPLDGSTFAEPPALPPAPRKPSSTTRGYMWTPTTGWARQDTSFNLSTPRLYVPFYDGAPDGIKLLTVMAAKDMGILPASMEIVGFKRAWLKGPRNLQTLAKHNWIAFDPQTWWQANVPVATITKSAKQLHLAQYFSKQQSTQIVYCLMTWRTQHKAAYTYTPAMATALDEPTTSSALAFMTGPLSSPILMGYQSAVQTAAYAVGIAEANAFIAEYETFLAAHPMLKCVDWYSKKLDFATYLAYITR